MRKHVKLLVAGAAAAILIATTLSFWFADLQDQAYQKATVYDGAYKLIQDSYYKGSPLPGTFQTEEPSPASNGNASMVNLTASYVLSNFTYVLFLHNSLGSFTIGVYVTPQGEIYQPAALANGHASPVVFITLLNASYARGGNIAFVPAGLYLSNGMSQLNPTIGFSPFVVSMMTKKVTVNFTTRTETIHTLGTVWNLNPRYNTSMTLVSNYSTGWYLFHLSLRIYGMTQAGIQPAGFMNITEPWALFVD